MTLDEKLESWGEATEAIVPSEALLAKLQAVVDAPTPPPAGPAAVFTAVKVLIITALAGALAYGVFRSQEVGWRWFGSSTPEASVDAGPLTPLRDSELGGATREPGLMPCGAPPASPEMLVAMPANTPDMRASYEEEQRRRRAELRHLLIKRPLTCVAQRNVLEQLLQLHGSDADEAKWSARLGYLCGPSAIPSWLTPSRAVPERPCDNSDWCRRPACDLKTEACVLRWLERPATSCTHSMGLTLALPFACVRYLRGEGTEAQVRELSSDAWCLKADALKERDELAKRNAPKESP